MTWNSRYLPPEATLWQGRSDSPSHSAFFQVIQLLNLNQITAPPANTLAFALLGFCCDEGIRRNLGRTGAAAGPDAIRTVLAKLPIQRNNIVCYDAGNITCTDGNLEGAQQALGAAVALLLQNNIVPIVLGGGHEIAFGHYQGIAKVFPDNKLGIVNFDAHFDMRELLPNQQGTSGTPFLQIANAQEKKQATFDYNCIGIQHAGNHYELLNTAKTHQTQVLWADDLHQNYKDKCVNFVERIIEQNQMLYITICLDVFATPYAPGVSAPQTLGLTPWQVIPLLRQLASSGKVTNYDLAEMSPAYDQDQRTAKLAANLIFEIIHHHLTK